MAGLYWWITQALNTLAGSGGGNAEFGVVSVPNLELADVGTPLLDSEAVAAPVLDAALVTVPELEVEVAGAEATNDAIQGGQIGCE